MRIATAILLCLLVTSCYRTHYVSFSTQNPNRSPATAVAGEPFPSGSAWQHFFIYGLVPGMRRIDAREACNGAENIESIQTRRTFAQGLVAAFAGYYINIYSPWNGAVYCKDTQR